MDQELIGFLLAQFACADPDGDGDIIIAKVTFKCQALGDADITISTIPNFDTVVACSAYNYDPEIQPNTITIHQQQDICEGNFDGDQDVDGTDAAVFKSDFGSNQYNEPCPSTTTTTITTGGCPYGMVDCGDKCVDPMTDEDYCGASGDCLGGTTCGDGEVCNSGVCENCSADNNYEPCIINDDCDSGCCCDEGIGVGSLCHSQTYCEEVLMRDCVEVTTSSTTTTVVGPCGDPPCGGACSGDDCCCYSPIHPALDCVCIHATECLLWPDAECED